MARHMQPLYWMSGLLACLRQLIGLRLKVIRVKFGISDQQWHLRLDQARQR